MKHILYLHGFRSSPASFKARLLADTIHQRRLPVVWHCPALPPSPRAAIALAQASVPPQAADSLVIIGSSLGGYYATWLAEQTGAHAIVINPVVQAARELARHVGPQAMYHNDQDTFEFRPEYVDELQALAVSRLHHPQRYLLLAATGDELLDWREMRDHYRGARQIIVPGSDHSLSDFADWLPDVLAFAGIDNATPTP